ncbi:hypothetical protein BSL78_23760 [Apostichopus japonicus]|uniref:Uncharacterized protein n=1 Tax=Stichopus japonicus TaxID=307972 RepID=A0A2G8JUJ1_STIJA|nr:hypothetical protein BSL78_23760 [Apostichopus japonicus]
MMNVNSIQSIRLVQVDTNWSTNNGQFNISLSDTGQLLITQGDICLENLLLTNSKDKFKILIKGDSMLFAVKLKNDVRRFRIMFAESESKSVSAEHFCIECTTAVRKHCPVRVVKQDGRAVHDTDTVTSQSSALDSSQQEIEGEVSLSKMVELLTSGDLTRLPCAYQGDLCTAPSTMEKDSSVVWLNGVSWIRNFLLSFSKLKHNSRRYRKSVET